MINHLPFPRKGVNQTENNCASKACGSPYSDAMVHPSSEEENSIMG